jgi:hypothetical protein
MPARSWARSIRSPASSRLPCSARSSLLGIFPLIARKVVEYIRDDKVYRRLEAAAPLRPQPRRHRRRQRRTGHRLHRGRRESPGHAGRKEPHGRRLPEHRLRALQGADPLGQSSSRRSRVHRNSASRRRAPNSSFADVMERVRAVIRADRAARFGRTLHGAWRRCHRRHGKDRLALGSRNCAYGWREAASVDAQPSSSPPVPAPSSRRSPASKPSAT